MEDGDLILAARSDNKDLCEISIYIVLFCLFVFLLHGRFLYNVVAGPHELKPRQLSGWSLVRHVSYEGPIEMVGVEILGTDNEVARFGYGTIDERQFIIKLPSTGKRTSGGICKIPKEVRKEFGKPGHYAMMIDASGRYIWQSNIFLYLTMLFFPLALWVLIQSLRERRDISQHWAFKELAEMGPLPDMLHSIETDVEEVEIVLGEGTLFCSDTWIVITEPSLIIIHVPDLIVFGYTKNSVDVESLQFFRRGKDGPVNAVINPRIIKRIGRALAERYPWAVVNDMPAFTLLWAERRDECIAKIDAARG